MKKIPKNLNHRGLRSDRDDIFTERIFLDLWEEENKRVPMVNFGNTALELILNTNKFPVTDDLVRPRKVSEVTQRDADVAATVIQWLGSKCGACFLLKAELAIKKEAQKLQEEFNEKYNRG